MPSILVVGATGNTGRGVVQTLADFASKGQCAFKIIGLTRDVKSASSKALAALEHVEMLETNWTDIQEDWLQKHEVERVFIASHNGPSHFTDESLFFNRALSAGVKYAVRISTTKSNVSPTTPVWYARNHWAVETMLEQPGFNAMGWTSLQPNVFTSFIGAPAEQWLKTYKETGEKTPFKYMLDGDANVAVVDATEVGIVAAHLLQLQDTKPHHGKKYVVAGPTNLSGKAVVKLIEKYAGTSVDTVIYRDTSIIEGAMAAGMSRNIADSLGKAAASGFNGACSVEHEPTSEELVKLYAPKNGALEAIDKALAAI